LQAGSFDLFHLGKNQNHFKVKIQISMLKTLILSLNILTTDTLPPTNQLLASIDSFYRIKTEAELLEYQVSKKGEWLKYLPTVGIQYTMDGIPRPILSFSSSILYKGKQDKQVLAAKRRAITGQNEMEAWDSKVTLLEKIDGYKKLNQQIEVKRKMLKIDSLLFKIHQHSYENMEMAPSEFLVAKKHYLEQLLRFQQATDELDTLRREIIKNSITK